MKKKGLVFKGLIFFVFCFFVFPIRSYGEAVPLAVQPILPDNQINDTDGFFNLRMSPGEKQTIALEVTNSGDEPVTIHTEIVPAATGMTGNIVYNEENIDKIDESNKYPLTKIAEVPKDITIPAKEKTTVDVALSMPEEAFEGVLLGGIKVAVVDKNKDEDSSKEAGFSVKNTYSYVIGIQLSEQDELPKPDLKILKIYASQIAGRNTLKINLQNPTRTIMNGVSYDAMVYQKGKNEVLHQASYQNYRIAPTNNYDLPVTWDNKPFKAGTYLLKLEATSKNPEDSWSFEQEFTITEKEAKELNDKAVELDEDYTVYIIIGIIAGVLLLILTIVFIVSRNKKKKQQRRRKSNGGKGKQSAKPKSQRPTNGQRKPVQKRPDERGKKRR